MKIAKVVFDIPIEQSFAYICEEETNKFVRVLVPFGNRDEIGFIIDFEEKKLNFEYKKIKKIYDKKPLINDEIFDLVCRVSKKYYSSLGQTVFSIIGSLPKKYSLELEESEIEFLLPVQEYKKEIYLFSKLDEKIEFYTRKINNSIGSVILLVPEVYGINFLLKELDQRIKKRILKYFGEMTKREKLYSYLQTLNYGKLLVIGTRSAIFLPVQDLELIIIDSYIDSSYTEKKTPRYNVIEVAEERAIKRKIPLILVSHSISLQDYLNAKEKKISVIDKRKLMEIPEVIIVEKKPIYMDKKISFFTSLTSSLLEETLLRGKKVGIIHNLKGTNKTYKCEKCGYILRCKKCNTPLVLIDNENFLTCRYCKNKEKIMIECTKCRSKKVIERIIGIEKIYKVLRDTYKDFRVEKFTSEIKEIKESDIYVGTTIIKKILNIFDFGLIIFPHADFFLNIPEYDSEERFFYLINDILFCLKNRESKILIQTKNPNFELFQSLKIKDFKIFYEKEIKTRKVVDYPPFSKILLFEIPLKKSLSFEKRLIELKKVIAKCHGEIIHTDFTEKKGTKIMKIVTKIKEKMPEYYKIMELKNKMGFKIETNSGIF